MAETTTPAYNPTTVRDPAKSTNFFSLAVDRKHFILKIAQLVLSFVAFLCEEIIDQCDSCVGLYIFEFVSCSAFLLAILMLVVYCTPLKNKIIIPSFKKIDFYVTGLVGVIFFIAAIVFAATMDKTSLGQVSVAFGFFAAISFLLELWFMHKSGYLAKNDEKQTPGSNGIVETEPLNTPVQVSANEA
ncbi:CKLF-like MARVEL transmembrane domain-containing protein 6 [Rhinoderma darwinii]|uniref:CKLF-like MARVEL transmembrane domain-containing protein 6 n=1 Tax=Rhinoderma darwinii TaxID=43563 RepID=UPI003F680884